jgi:hypothetical protein
MNKELTPKQQDDIICKQPLSEMGRWRFFLFMLGRAGAHEIFCRVVGRAYERSFINSTQLHELHGIWNRMTGRE